MTIVDRLDHYEGGRHIPASTRNWPNVGLMKAIVYDAGPTLDQHRIIMKEVDILQLARGIDPMLV